MSIGDTNLSQFIEVAKTYNQLEQSSASPRGAPNKKTAIFLRVISEKIVNSDGTIEKQERLVVEKTRRDRIRGFLGRLFGIKNYSLEKCAEVFHKKLAMIDPQKLNKDQFEQVSKFTDKIQEKLEGRIKSIKNEKKVAKITEIANRITTTKYNGIIALYNGIMALLGGQKFEPETIAGKPGEKEVHNYEKKIATMKEGLQLYLKRISDSPGNDYLQPVLQDFSSKSFQKILDEVYAACHGKRQSLEKEYADLCKTLEIPESQQKKVETEKIVSESEGEMLVHQSVPLVEALETFVSSWNKDVKTLQTYIEKQTQATSDYKQGAELESYCTTLGIPYRETKTLEQFRAESKNIAQAVTAYKADVEKFSAQLKKDLNSVEDSLKKSASHLKTIFQYSGKGSFEIASLTGKETPLQKAKVFAENYKNIVTQFNNVLGREGQQARLVGETTEQSLYLDVKESLEPAQFRTGQIFPEVLKNPQDLQTKLQLIENTKKQYLDWLTTQENELTGIRQLTKRFGLEYETCKERNIESIKEHLLTFILKFQKKITNEQQILKDMGDGLRKAYLVRDQESGGPQFNWGARTGSWVESFSRYKENLNSFKESIVNFMTSSNQMIHEEYFTKEYIQGARELLNPEKSVPSKIVRNLKALLTNCYNVSCRYLLPQSAEPYREQETKLIECLNLFKQGQQTVFPKYGEQISKPKTNAKLWSNDANSMREYRKQFHLHINRLYIQVDKTIAGKEALLQKDLESYDKMLLHLGNMKPLSLSKILEQDDIFEEASKLHQNTQLIASAKTQINKRLQELVKKPGNDYLKPVLQEFDTKTFQEISAAVRSACAAKQQSLETEYADVCKKKNIPESEQRKLVTEKFVFPGGDSDEDIPEHVVVPLVEALEIFQKEIEKLK